MTTKLFVLICVILSVGIRMSVLVSFIVDRLAKQERDQGQGSLISRMRRILLENIS